MGCGEGGCGSCTVMVSKFDRRQQKEVHIPINSCITPICSLHGLAVTTVEGIGSMNSQLHPVQERIAKAHGSQCGFCTPGMVMSMYVLLRQNSKPNMKHMLEALKGNFCRCTGYRPIIDGFKTFTKEWDASKVVKTEERLFKTEEFAPYRQSQESIFPLELKISNKYDTEYLIIKGPRTTWLRPTTLNQLLTKNHKIPEVKIIAGSTIAIFEFANSVFPLMVHSKGIPEMTEICETSDGVRVGASAVMENIQRFLQTMENKYTTEETRLFKSICKIIRLMACKQVRSVGSMGGNIISSSSTCDLIPILMASRVQLEIYHKENGVRSISFDSNFSLRGHKNVLKQDEVLVAIHLPFSNGNQYFEVYKIAQRRDVDETSATLAVKVEFEDNTNQILSIFIGIAGVAQKAVEASKTQKKLKGLPWTRTTLEQAYIWLLEDLRDISAHHGMLRYRKSLVLSLFLKIFLAILEQLQCNLDDKNKVLVDSRELSGIKSFGNSDYKSSQYFDIVPEKQLALDLAQRPMVHSSAFKHATGEAIFIDDMPRFENELSIAYIFSKKSHANIVSIDASEALKTEGVHAFISGNDISSEINETGRFFKGDEQVFYSKKVTSQGQIIGAILAEHQHIAQRAAKLVKVKYELLEPLIITIEDAIKHESYFDDFTKEICHENVDEILKKAPHLIKGSCRIGNQKHYSLEVQSCLVVPQSEDDVMDIYCSTQCPVDLANAAANLLGIHQNKIKVHVKRVGGAFGGKEWKSIVVAQPAILAARKFRRPIRCVLERNQDMLMSGGRVSYLFNYIVGFDDQGHILACDFDIYLNCGHSLEINHIGLSKSLDHLDNAFNISVIRAKGRLCKTHVPSTTAMTGFGASEGQFPITCIIEEIAEYLKKDPVEIAEINLYTEGDTSFYGQKMKNCTIKECWEECIERFKYWTKREDIQQFNSKNLYKKRGLGIVPTKFGIGVAHLPPPFLQASALINVYTDGSVVLSYGGVEMGQGLHTKMIQLVTRVLEIPSEKIYIEETATNIVPNCPSTIASITSDICGKAVVNACKKILVKLHPHKEANPTGTWEEVVMAAHWNKVCLSATGCFKHDPKGLDPNTKTGNLFNFFVYGAACSEVEVDLLTGDHQVLRSDIVLDLGQSLNPAIDIGQIEGGFMQGYGLFVMENTVYSSEGTLLSNGLATYKIPGVGDIPLEFNVSLLKLTSNTRADAYLSKDVEEAPLILASSVYFAIKDAIKAARKENGASTAFHISSPATAEKIRLACEDHITKMVPPLIQIVTE